MSETRKTALDVFKGLHPVTEFKPFKEWSPDVWLVEDWFLSGGKITAPRKYLP